MTRTEPAVNRVVALAQQRWALTPRETDVLRGLLAGHDNQTVADAMGCTRRTVEAHITSTLVKTGARSRLELVSLCWHRWLDHERGR